MCMADVETLEVTAKHCYRALKMCTRYRCTDLKEGLQIAVLEAFNWTLGSTQQLIVDRELGLGFGWRYQGIIKYVIVILER